MASNKRMVLEVARQLFNEQGTAAVSTNHIAQAAGISPGNLYYHFRSKQDILLALFERWFAETGERLNLPADRPPTVDDIPALIRVNFHILREYAFIYRELPALLRQSAVLAERYQTVRARGYEGFHQIISALVGEGVLHPLAPSAVTALADVCWLITEFWPSSLDVTGKPLDDDGIERGVQAMMQVFAPYIIPKAD